ncbi:MAG: hypothetical protein HUU32_06500 [Calditrichaceae bacterium]|nr:hypothetical protein [Calditrichia bacterium]NUQ41029.1 hypothetical protein [Calditrichaceae bacterium]
MNGLETEYNGALKCEIKDGTTPESKAEIRQLGFKTHGLVVYDLAGNIKAKLDGHQLSEEEIREALGKAL